MGGMLTELGIGGVFAILVIREVTGFLRGRSDISSRDERWKKLEQVVDQTRDLHEWHSVKDRNGLPVWYVKRSLEEAIDKLAENTDRQSHAIERLTDVVERVLEGRR